MINFVIVTQVNTLYCIFLWEL